MKLRLIAILSVVLIGVGCSPIEQQARNTAAALGGLLSQVQTQNQATCTASPSDKTCTLINQGISAQNALITAAEAYCGWSSQNPPGDPTTNCKPVKTAQAGLQTAIANANQFISQLKGVVK